MTQAFKTSLSGLLGVMFIAVGPSGAEVFTGPNITFSKAGFADPALPESQDRITDSVWITRADIRGLFNAAQEPAYQNSVSPLDTEWAFSGLNGNPGDATFSAANFAALSFADWKTAHVSDPTDTLGIPGVVHLISDDHYIDIMFTDWGVGANDGGSFTYMRATQSPSGDFDGDGDFDCDDVNQLAVEIANMAGNPDFDLTGDGNVNGADLERWLLDAGTQNIGAAYLGADANLDGDVNGQDFLVWNTFKFQSVNPASGSAPQGFCDGDFNADGDVNGQDFLVWNNLKFSSSSRAAPVPEPGNWVCILLVAVTCSGYRCASAANRLRDSVTM